MAKIPTAADLPQVAPVRTRAVQIPDGAMGGIGDGLVEAGGAIFEFAIKKRDEYEDTEAQDLLNKLSKTRRELYEGTDEQEGYSTLTGKTALERRQEFEEKFGKERDRLLSQASNDRIRRKIEGKFAAQTEQFMSNVAGHKNGQQIKYDDDVYASTITEAEQSAISAPDEQTRRQYITDIKTATYNHFMKRTGDAKIAESEAEKAVTKAHSDVINDMLLKPDGAKMADEYLTKNRTGIDADEFGKLKNAIKEGSLLETGQKAAQAAADKYDLSDAAQAEQALAEVRKQYAGKPEQKKAAEDAVMSRIKEEAAFTTMKERQARESAIGKLAADGQAKLTAPELAALLSTTGGATYLKQRREGEEVKTDQKVYNELNTMDRRKFTFEVDLTQYVGKLSETDWKYMSNLQRSYRDTFNSNDAKAITDLSTTQQDLTTAVNELGLSGTKNDEKRGRFLRRGREALDAARAKKGADLTDTERREVLRGLQREQIKFDTTLKDEFVNPSVISQAQLIEMADEVMGIENETHREIFAVAYDQIVRTMRANSIPITNANITAMWNANKSKYGVK